MKVSEVGSNINIPFIKHHVLKGIIQYPVLYRIHLPYMDLFAWGGGSLRSHHFMLRTHRWCGIFSYLFLTYV